ncbi:hypothetical protein NL108_017245 [Boleophthalmus pectinirostris]|nr:hypothetical protein NL108_017245 [Boleophthalmus pectinirostris]
MDQVRDQTGTRALLRLGPDRDQTGTRALLRLGQTGMRVGLRPRQDQDQTGTRPGPDQRLRAHGPELKAEALTLRRLGVKAQSTLVPVWSRSGPGPGPSLVQVPSRSGLSPALVLVWSRTWISPGSVRT